MGEHEAAQDMYDVMRVLQGEWFWDVFSALHENPLQYKDLLLEVRSARPHGWPGKRHRFLRDSTLNRTLRRLERMGLVDRRRGETWPFHATYGLTEATQDLLVQSRPMIKWAQAHSEVIEAARRARAADGS